MDPQQQQPAAPAAVAPASAGGALGAAPAGEWRSDDQNLPDNTHSRPTSLPSTPAAATARGEAVPSNCATGPHVASPATAHGDPAAGPGAASGAVVVEAVADLVAAWGRRADLALKQLDGREGERGKQELEQGGLGHASEGRVCNAGGKGTGCNGAGKAVSAGEPGGCSSSGVVCVAQGPGEDGGPAAGGGAMGGEAGVEGSGLGCWAEHGQALAVPGGAAAAAAAAVEEAAGAAGISETERQYIMVGLLYTWCCFTTWDPLAWRTGCRHVWVCVNVRKPCTAARVACRLAGRATAPCCLPHAILQRFAAALEPRM